MRRLKAATVRVALSMFCSFILLTTAYARADEPAARPFDISPQSLTTALSEFARQSQQEILFAPDVVAQRFSSGVRGTMQPLAALKLLLKDSALAFTTTPNGAILVGPPPTGGASSLSSGEESAAPKPAGEEADKENHSPEETQTQHKNAEDRIRVAQVNQAETASDSSVRQQDAQISKNSIRVEEVVVTAQKVQERSLDVPMSLTVLSGDQLVSSQSFRFEDYVGKVPGLTLVDYGALGSQLVIRGLTSGSVAVNSSVATYIDETPYNATGVFAGSWLIAANLDTFDMRRIEVLKGPQGTLYGSNALGGLLKYVTNAPDPSGFAANVEAGVRSVYNGGAGFDTHAMVNIPITDDAALRLTGYDNYYPGFIDDPSRGKTDINGTHFTGGRASMLYAPTSDISVRFNALYQNRSYGDWGNEDVNSNTLTPIHGNFVQENLISQPGHTTVRLYNVTVNWNAELLKLISTTSYYDNSVSYLGDVTRTLGAFASAILGAPYGFAAPTGPRSIHGLTQEVRLSSPEDKPLQWQIGGYFTNQSGATHNAYFPIDLTTRTILFNISRLGVFDNSEHFREYAGFVNLDYHITRVFDVAVGGRYSENRQTFRENTSGPVVGNNSFETLASEGVFTYSGDARWHVTPESMLYARVAEGFAPGGPNSVILTAPAPHTYSSSTTVNYELGIKSSLLDEHLTVEVSGFYTNWRKIQLRALVNGFNTYINGGGARSGGVEWNFAYVPINGLKLNLNGAYTHAYLTQATPVAVNGHVGDRLPAVPLCETSASVEYRRLLLGSYSGFAGVDWRFEGSRFADFVTVGPRQKMPSFNIVDLRAGAENPKWSYSFYVKNVGNKIAINYLLPETSAGGAGPQSAILYTPRTFGVTLTARF